MMTWRFQAESAATLTMAWRSPTNRPYGSVRISPLAPASIAHETLEPLLFIDFSRPTTRRQVALGGAFREKVRLRRSSCRALPRLWRRGSSVRCHRLSASFETRQSGVWILFLIAMVPSRAIRRSAPRKVASPGLSTTVMDSLDGSGISATSIATAWVTSQSVPSATTTDRSWRRLCVVHGRLS